jgi:hypothetical protein
MVRPSALAVLTGLCVPGVVLLRISKPIRNRFVEGHRQASCWLLLAHGQEPAKPRDHLMVRIGQLSFDAR